MSASASCVRLLGHPGAERAGQSLRGLERNPKKLAVLAYLALQPPQKFVARDALLAVFWSESPEKPARHALSQTLHFIRQHLGADALLTSGPNLLKLNPAIVEADVRQFEAALDSGDVEHACALYRGELLEGLSLESDATDWLDRERQRLRTRAADALWRQAASCVRAGTTETATQNAQRAIECDPTDEGACSQFLHVAVEAKQFAAARAVGSFFAITLERVSGGDTPSAEFLARVRQLADVRAETATPPAPLPEKPRTETARPVAPPRRRRSVLLNALGALAAVAVVAFAIRSLAVRPGLGRAGPALVLQLVISTSATPEKDLELLIASVGDVVADDFNGIGWRVFTPTVKASDAQPAGYALELRALRGDTGVVFTYRMRDAVSEVVLASGTIRTAAKPDVSAVGRTIADDIRSEIGRKQPVLGTLSELESADLQRVAIKSSLAQSLFDSGSLEAAARAYQVADSAFAATKWSRRTSLIAGVRRLKQLESLAMVEFYLSDYAGKDSVFARAERFANDLVKRYKSRPEPLEARASLRFVQTFFSASPSLQMLDSVEADLNVLIERHQGSSSAFTRLSAVLEQKGELLDARVMANAAAKRDDFLAYDKDILFRQFRLSFNLDDDPVAEQNCANLERRYPDETPSSVCRLMLMGWSKASPLDTAEARRIVRSGAADEAEGMRRLTIPRLEAFSAGVFARAGHTDRARDILRKLEPSKDPELVHLRAAVLALLGDMEEARALARQFAEQTELTRITLRTGRLYRSLLDDSPIASR